MGSKLTQALSELEKNYGKGMVTFAAELPNIPKISTGILTLDADLGGGIPKSRLTVLIGEPSASKTTVALLAAASMQQMETLTNRPLVRVLDEATPPSNFDGLLVPHYKYYLKDGGEEAEPGVVILLDVEGTFDRSWAMALGVDLNKLVVTKPDFLEQTFDIIHGLVKTGEVDMIILDSIAAMTPAKEFDMSVEDDTMGLQARKNGQGLRKLISLMNQIERDGVNAPAVVAINQKRLKIGVMYGNPETVPGGRAWEFYAAVRISFRQDAKNSVKVKDEVVGRAFTYKIEKNKMNGFTRDGGFVVYGVDHGPYLKGQPDSYGQVLDLASRIGIIDARGAGVYVLGEEKIRGKDNVIDYLMSNPDYFNTVKDQVMETLSNA